MTGVAEVLQEVTPHGSGVVINPPVYPPFFFRLRLAGRRVVEAPLRRDADGRYHLDSGAVDAALAADGVAAYLLCSPHNPTGRVWSRDDLTAVADICARRGAVLIVDEIHAPLALPGASHIPFLSLDLGGDLAQRTFTFTSASKGWNIPGLKCGARRGRPAKHAAAALERRWEALLRQPPGRAGHRGRLRGLRALAGRGLRAARREPRCCWPSCWPSTCPRWVTGRRRQASWPGWTVARWTLRTRRRSSWTAAGWASPRAPVSASRAAGSSG